jgi:hypothetical protein
MITLGVLELYAQNNWEMLGDCSLFQKSSLKGFDELCRLDL